MIKHCNKCGVDRPTSEFYSNRSRRDGLSVWCKSCTTRDSIKRQEMYSDSVGIRKTQSSKTCCSCGVEKPSCHFGVDRHQKGGLKCHCLECDRMRQRLAYHSNIDSAREKLKIRSRNRLKNPKARLYNATKVGIYKYLKANKGGRSWPSFLQYSFYDYCEHLERQFYDGMSWDNYGEWHVDHVIPVSAFNFDHPESIDFKRCWALENLRPLWANENISKNDKLDKPFQPSLLLRVGNNAS